MSDPPANNGNNPPAPKPVPSDYKGSQAFNNIVTTDDESINPNTGSLIFSAPLFALRGIKPSVDLSVRMWYSEGMPGTFGLPKDWGLDLPIIVLGTDSASLTLKTRTYAMDASWESSTKYQSGLRYVNDRGINLVKLTTPAALPSKKEGQYTYKLQSDDGSTDYFDSTGKVLEHDDLYGNFIYYSYATANPTQLQYISDSWGQQIKFDYKPGSEMRVTLPDNSQSVVAFSDATLTSMTDPVGDVTSFKYEVFDDGKDKPELLSHIEYPSGAVSDFKYVGIDFLDAAGTAGKLPAVSDRYSRDSNGIQLAHSTYVYGDSEKGHTYTGFALKLKMLGTSDALMDDMNPDGQQYTYDVLKTDLDEKDKPLRKTRTIYNHLHLSIAEIQMNSSNAAGQFLEVYRDTSTYPVPNNQSDAHTVNYERPLITESFRNTNQGGDAAWQSMRQTNFTYTEFGHAITVEELISDTATGYIKQSTVTNGYQITKLNTEILTDSSDFDEISLVTYRTQNVLTSDEKDIASTSLSSAPGQASQAPWKTRQYQYDSRGRVVNETLAWSAGHAAPAGTVSIVAYRKEYSDLVGGLLTQTDYDATNNPTLTQHDLRINTGPIVSKTLPGKQTEAFRYDAVGRLVEHTDALGNKTTTAYSISKTGNWEKKTTPNGYTTLITFDTMSREVSRQDNGGPSPPTIPTRYLSRKSYDALSRVVKSVDNLGLTTTYTYDGLSRPLSIVDARQNTVNYEYDDGNLKVTQKLNGDLRSVEILNGRLQVVQMLKYPDSGDTSIKYFLREDTEYDGENRIISKKRSEMVGQGNNPNMRTLQTETIQYGPESSVVSRVATGLADSGTDEVKRTYSYDLFGNTYTYEKTTTYAASGSTFVNKGPLNVYDANNRLVSTSNQEGGHESWTYDANGWLQESMRLNGETSKYQYDALGHNIMTTYPDSTTTQTTYDADGRTTKVVQDTKAMSYEYTLDGVIIATHYPDAKSTSYTLDRYSRVISVSDAVGATGTTTYDKYGDIKLTAFESDVVQYEYGTVNHTNGKLTSTSLTGTREYQRFFSYDGFDRTSKDTVKDPAGQILLENDYDIDGRGRLQWYTSTSQSYPAARESRKYRYDGLNQVISDTRIDANNVTTSILYAYDGNSNVVQKEVGNAISKMTYNSIDQRTDSGISYDANGRMIHDDAGQTYTFDSRDRLSSVATKANVNKQFSYYPDDSLAGTVSGSDATTIYYDGKSINAMNVSLQSISHNASIFRDSDRIVANYTDGVPNHYFLDRHASTALLMPQAGAPTSSMTYTAYGAQTTTPTLDTESCFGFQQELFDQLSGLVYLRSRYYNANLAAFVSMDTYREENRYAYCKGDPINLIDANGHMPSWLKKTLAIGAGLVVGAIVSFATAGVLGPLVGTAVAGIIGGAAGGAAGNITSGVIGAKLDGRKYTGQQALIDGLLGGIGGAAGAAAGFALGEAAGPVQGLFKKGLLWAGKRLVGSAASKAEQALLKPIITKDVHIAWNIGSTIRHGDPAGVAQILASGRKSILSPQALAVMYATVEGAGNQVQSSQSVVNSVYHPLTFDSSAKSSGSVGTPSTSNAVFDMSFSTAHDWAPASMASISQEVNKRFDSQWTSWNDALT